MSQVTIPFDPKWNAVAISLSGGADSALLAYMVCSMAPPGFNIHIISHIRCWKTRPWQQWDSLRVYEYLVQKFPLLNFKRHINFISPELEYGSVGPNLTDEYGKLVSGDNIEKRAFAEYVCFYENCDAYYNGVTRNPRLAKFNGMLERDIEPSEENKHLEYMIHMDKVASHPFRFVDKAWIVLQYKALGIMDLFNITRSCEGEFEDINYKNYTPGQYVPVCGKCFWCQERQWALSCLD